MASLEELKNEWLKALEAPETRQMFGLIATAFGTGLLQPVAPGQNAVANALGAATRAAGAAAQMQAETEKTQQQIEMERQRLAEAQRARQAQEALSQQELQLRREELAQRRQESAAERQFRLQLEKMQQEAKRQLVDLEARRQEELAKRQLDRALVVESMKGRLAAKLALIDYLMGKLQNEAIGISDFPSAAREVNQIARALGINDFEILVPEEPSPPPPPPAAARPEVPPSAPLDVPRGNLPEAAWKMLPPEAQAGLANLAAAQPGADLREAWLQAFVKNLPRDTARKLIEDPTIPRRFAIVFGDQDFARRIFKELRKAVEGE